MRRWLLVAAGLWVATAVSAACPSKPADGETPDGDAVSLSWLADPMPIVQGQPFALRLTVCPASAVLVAVDATMPEHRHGMNYRPTLQALGGGRWRAEGLLWHMSGRWELRFDLRHHGTLHTLRRDVVLP